MSGNRRAAAKPGVGMEVEGILASGLRSSSLPHDGDDDDAATQLPASSSLLLHAKLAHHCTARRPAHVARQAMPSLVHIHESSSIPE